MYQIRRRFEGDEWQDCTDREAHDILSAGYFDPDPAIELLEQGKTVATSTHHIRINPQALIVQRRTPTPEANGDVLFG